MGLQCGPCQTRMQHGWDVLPMVMSGRKIYHALIPIFAPSRTLPFARVGLRPRRRRRLNIPSPTRRRAPARCNSPGKRSSDSHGGDGAYRPVHVVRSDGSVRTLQVFIPELFKGFAPDGVRDGERLAARPGARWYAAETGAGDPW